MSVKKRIIIFYDYFYPGYKAGGPIQSLLNLTNNLCSLYSMFIITSAYDLNTNDPYENIEIDSWNYVKLPGSNKLIPVYYNGKGRPGFRQLKKLVEEIQPNFIYLNGIYSFRLFLMPVLIKSFYMKQIRAVVCPRGMFQPGALAVKSHKKKYYLKFLQALGLLNEVRWHATTPKEAKEIEQYFPTNNAILVAPNIPKAPLPKIKFENKQAGRLKLIFLALISEMKNLDIILKVLQKLPEGITLDIYGPIKNEVYWQECKEMIEKMPEKVNYLGGLAPRLVQETLAQYHAMILFSRAENFGHAIYESLSVGRPVIISKFTPWNELRQKFAGINVEVTSIQECIDAITFFADMDQEDYNKFCEGAHALAMQYFKNDEVEKQYENLFSA
jgi:glycosyltransferase involved in cell wall biosynthesis